MRTTLTAIVIALAPSSLCAQDIPPYVPLNPALAARSALHAQPFVSPHAGWRTRIVGDYSNAVEVSTAAGSRQYVFDAEVFQADVWLSRDVSERVFVVGNVALRGAHAGGLDGALNWYHDLIGLRVPARNQRTENRFAWELELGGDSIVRQSATFIGEARIGAGIRLGPRMQLIGTLTVPTATTSADGWARGTIGTSLAFAARVASTERVAVEVGGSIGWTPTHGDLAAFQRTVFVAGMIAGRWRFAGRQSVYSTMWVQSASWKNTGFGALDDAEVTLDFGALLQVGGGLPELQIGMTEDLLPSGPAIDAGFKFGVRW